MSKKFDRRLLDTNAMVMGGGVGLAALESMFNLVQTQSLLSASMVRDHDLSYGLSLEALALSLGEVLDPGVYGSCRPCRCTSKVKVDIPAASAPSANPPDDSGNQRGAMANADVLADMARDTQSTTTTTTQTADPGISAEKLMETMAELHGKLVDHADRVADASRTRLMVT